MNVFILLLLDPCEDGLPRRLFGRGGQPWQTKKLCCLNVYLDPPSPGSNPWGSDEGYSCVATQLCLA